MTKTYFLDLPGLAEAIASCKVEKKHKALLDAIAKFDQLHNVKFGNSRGGDGSRWLSKQKVLDADGNVLADDHTEWLDSQVAQDGGAWRSTYYRIKDAGHMLAKCEIENLVLTCDQGGPQQNFIQLNVAVESEYIDRPLTGSFWGSGPYDLDDWKRSEALPYESRKLLRPISYRLSNVQDIAAFVEHAKTIHAERRVQIRETQVKLTAQNWDGTAGEVSVRSLASLDEGFDKFPWWRGERLLHDWSLSSAGRSGARLCDHWVMELQNYTPPEGKQLNPVLAQRLADFIPAWTHTFKMAKVEKAPSIHALYDKLLSIDRRTGVPFAWFFYMLHGNRVQDDAGHAVIRGAEAGALMLPEHDYQVLRRWAERPYGF
jgi:hypothetical protein